MMYTISFISETVRPALNETTTDATLKRGGTFSAKYWLLTNRPRGNTLKQRIVHKAGDAYGG